MMVSLPVLALALMAAAALCAMHLARLLCEPAKKELAA